MMKSGKAALGFKSVLKNIRTNQVQLILYSNNLPILRQRQIHYYCMLAKVQCAEYNGSNTDLGAACGKLFRVSVLGVINGGDSQIV